LCFQRWRLALLGGYTAKIGSQSLPAFLNAGGKRAALLFKGIPARIKACQHNQGKFSAMSRQMAGCLSMSGLTPSEMSKPKPSSTKDLTD
jgi:hypothetical protein